MTRVVLCSAIVLGSILVIPSQSLVATRQILVLIEKDNYRSREARVISKVQRKMNWPNRNWRMLNVNIEGRSLLIAASDFDGALNISENLTVWENPHYVGIGIGNKPVGLVGDRFFSGASWANLAIRLLGLISLLVFSVMSARFLARELRGRKKGVK